MQELLKRNHPSKAKRRLKRIGLAVVLLTLVGTAGLHTIERWSWFDSFYMVVITLSTIGYSEVHPLSTMGRAFNIGLIITGGVLVALAIGTLTQALLEFELTQFFDRRRMERQISRLSKHYIICGAGRVGRSAARELANKPASFVIIENDEAKAQRLPEGWPVLVGDATHESTLQQARITEAAGLVAATTTDANNIFIVLNARSLNPQLKIIARASEDEAAKHLIKAGAHSVVSPYSFAGHRIAQGLLRPNVLDFLDLATARDGKYEMIIEEIVIPKGSPFAGTTVGASRIHHDFGVIILAVKRADGHTLFNPQATHPIMGGDCLIAMGEPSSMSKLEVAAARMP